MKINAIVLSAGKGTRMKSDSPKVVQKVLNYEMINLVLASLDETGVDKKTLVLGYKKEEVLESIDPKFEIDYYVQEEQLGTGHAIKVGKDKLDDEGITLVTYGDIPLLTSRTYKKLIKNHSTGHNDLTILTARVDNPSGYGRIVRSDVGQIEAIIEEKDASELQKQISEINSGIYCFDTKKLKKYIDDISNENEQNEFYLTDLVKIFRDNEEKVSTYILPNQKVVTDEIRGVNNLEELEEVTQILRERINKQHMVNGVRILDTKSTFISPNVEIGTGTVIYPNNTIEGYCKIGEKNLLLPGNYIVDSNIENNSEFGPSCQLRPGTNIGSDVKIGNYVEIKKSTIGSGTKISHLTYIGDAYLGENINVGCGVITANYDGENKFKTIIHDDAFIGSNVTMVAPIEIKTGAFIAAGTTVSKNVDEKKFVIGRVKEEHKDKRVF